VRRVADVCQRLSTHLANEILSETTNIQVNQLSTHVLQETPNKCLILLKSYHHYCGLQICFAYCVAIIHAAYNYAE